MGAGVGAARAATGRASTPLMGAMPPKRTALTDRRTRHLARDLEDNMCMKVEREKTREIIPAGGVLDNESGFVRRSRGVRRRRCAVRGGERQDCRERRDKVRKTS